MTAELTAELEDLIARLTALEGILDVNRFDEDDEVK